MIEFKTLDDNVLGFGSALRYFKRDDYALAFSRLRQSQNCNGLSRINFHSDPNDPLHVMLVRLAGAIQYPKHRHLNKDEWYLVVEGTLGIVSEGADINLQPMDFMMMPRGKWHATMARTSEVFYFEVCNGPFDKTQTEFFNRVE